MVNKRLSINGEVYVSMDYLIDCLVGACLRYNFDGEVGSRYSESEGLEFVEDLLKRRMANVVAYDAFVRSYVHQKYPQVFGKEKES